MLFNELINILENHEPIWRTIRTTFDRQIVAAGYGKKSRIPSMDPEFYREWKGVVESIFTELEKKYQVDLSNKHTSEYRFLQDAVARRITPVEGVDLREKIYTDFYAILPRKIKEEIINRGKKSLEGSGFNPKDTENLDAL